MQQINKGSQNLVKVLIGYLLRGIFFVLPLLLSLYIIILLIKWVDGIFYQILPNSIHIPGFGALCIILALMLIGFISTTQWFSYGWKWIERFILRIPILNSLYRSVKNITDYVNPNNQLLDGRSVIVNLPGMDIQMMGFLTRRNLHSVSEVLEEDEDRVAVYFPMSYQVGGFTVFVPKRYVEQINIGVDEMMQGTLMAWVKGFDESRLTKDKGSNNDDE